ncbi:MAG: protein phosphatase 2C domain-containing protein [Bryobacteraceae bacterium]
MDDRPPGRSFQAGLRVRAVRGQRRSVRTGPRDLGVAASTARYAEDLRYNIDIAQHVGSRESQQDSYSIRQDESGWLGVICDGMSGYRDNAAAARAAAAAFAEQWESVRGGEDFTEWMEDALISAQSAVLDLGARAHLSPGVTGTTLLAAGSRDDRLWWISVGDTSLFLMRDELFELLNILHIQEMAGGAPGSYLGAPEIREVDRSPSPLRLRHGDLVLMASDGLTMAMTIDELGGLLRGQSDIGARDLVGRALAMDRPAQDNLTVIIVRVSDE